MADYQAYSDTQQKVSKAYRDRDGWIRMAILNSVRVGHFSSDRTIREYCRDIWSVKPVPITLDSYSPDKTRLNAKKVMGRS